MVDLLQLWLPILLSAVVVFIASALAWTVLPHHRADFKPVPDQKKFDQALASLGIKPGLYMFPYSADPKAMKEPAFVERWKAGPTGTFNLWANCPSMGRNMALSFLFYLVTSIFVAYVCTLGLREGDSYLRVFQLAGTTAIMAYCFGSIPKDIWFNTPRRAVVTCIIDGIVFGLLTAGVFGWLWPSFVSAPTP
ncbi:MAG: hypothetical protein IIB78_05950 [Proteobacteria bacterium]|nr:hypothetical protein [Pseudomonadota bacterium]